MQWTPWTHSNPKSATGSEASRSKPPYQLQPVNPNRRIME